MPEQTFPAGALIAADFDEFMAGKRDFTVLFRPDAATSLAGHCWTRNFLLLNVLDDVKNRIAVLDPASGWRAEPLAGAPAIRHAVGVGAG